MFNLIFFFLFQDSGCCKGSILHNVQPFSNNSGLTELDHSAFCVFSVNLFVTWSSMGNTQMHGQKSLFSFLVAF